MNGSTCRFSQSLGQATFGRVSAVPVQCGMRNSPATQQLSCTRGFTTGFSGIKQQAPRSQALKSFERHATQPAAAEPPAGMKYATFAGGCFWGVELLFQRIPGVQQTYVGYTQGQRAGPSYNEVCSGSTGHTEAVLVIYDPNTCQFRTLLDEFFNFVDPTTKDRQGGDMGTQYRSGIYYHDEEQKLETEKKVEEVNAQLKEGLLARFINRRVVSEVLPAKEFYIAESYHQQYLAKGGRFGAAQSAEKGCRDNIRCYG